MPFTKIVSTDGLRHSREQCVRVLAGINKLGGALSVSAIASPGCVFHVPESVARKAIEERIARIDAELAERSEA